MAKKKKNDSNVGWILTITCLAFFISLGFSFVSNQILENVNVIVGIIVLLIFIFIGIIFDMIGVAITAADLGPFNALNARKTKGADVAVQFVKNADKVSSFCNDVVGDICGIVSGSASGIVAISIAVNWNLNILIVTLIVSALTAALTIGGKAVGKGLAIKSSTSIVFAFSKVISVFYRVKK